VAPVFDVLSKPWTGSWSGSPGHTGHRKGLLRSVPSGRAGTMPAMYTMLRVVPDEAVELSPLEQLERDELRRLALGVGDHLAAEIAQRVAAIRQQRALYEPTATAA
jgi:hypothetical protein